MLRCVRQIWPALVASLLVATVVGQNTNETFGSDRVAASIFISPEENIGFALNVPNDSSTDLLFTLRVPPAFSYGAIGFGQQMAGSLILMLYSSGSPSKGNGITLSTRIAYGHSEPVYTSDINIAALNGTGIVDDVMIFNGRCTNCRSWANGQIDVKSTSQPFIYASGPAGLTDSADLRADFMMHNTFGTFNMDMTKATGAAGVPDIPFNSANVGTTQGAIKVTGKNEWAAIFHAVILVFTFVGLMPFGVLIVRLGNWVRWHAVNQVLAMIGVIVGASLGIHISFFYNRSKNFNSAHQIIGLIIFIFIFVQFTLGFMHHRIYKKTQAPTQLAMIHTWVGRLIIVLGVTNAFLGFRLALAGRYNYILAGLVIFIFPAIGIIIFTKRFFAKRRAKKGETPAGGFNLEPWQQMYGQEGGQAAHQHANQPPYAPPQADTGAYPPQQPPPGYGVSVSSQGYQHPGYQHQDPRAGLGPERATREFA